MAQLEELKAKYQSVLDVIQQQGVRLQNVHLENNKLLIRGEAPSHEAKNHVWDQIKRVDTSYSDLNADIRVSAHTQAAAPQQQRGGNDRTYTVQPGDNLSKIAKQFYGNTSDYMKIFNANRDRLQDPDKIRAGQELVIP